MVRRYIGDEKYVVESLGAADDKQVANGDTILTFSQAQAAARKIAEQAVSLPEGSTGPLTVRDAIDEC